mgnify:CR=1 FL=1
MPPPPAACPSLPPSLQYPSEGIHKRWDGGYRITAAASTPDQVCGRKCVLEALLQQPDRQTNTRGRSGCCS